MRRLCAAASIVLAACSSPSEPVPVQDGSVVIVAPIVWLGSEVTLASTKFANAPLPDVRLNNASRPVRRIAADTIAVTVPDELFGLPPVNRFGVIVYLSGEAPVDAGDVLVDGGWDLDQTVPDLATALAWPDPYGVRIVGNTSTLSIGAPVVSFDFGTRQQSLSPAVPDTLAAASCLSSGPGPSVTGGIVLAGSRSGSSVPCGMVRVWAGGVATDSLTTSTTDYAAYLGAGRWLTWSNATFSLESSSSSPTPVIGWSAPNLTISPRGDRAAVSAGHAVGAGVAAPVFDVASGSVAYLVPGLSVGGSVFSRDGDTLFMAVAGFPGDRPRLLALSAAGGGVLVAGDTSTVVQSAGVVADSARPWIYVVGNDTAGFLAVDVFERPGLKHIATLRSLEQNLPLGPVFLDVQRRLLYVIFSGIDRNSVFQLLP